MKNLLIFMIYLSIISCKGGDDDSLIDKEQDILPTDVIHPLKASSDLDTLIDSFKESTYVLLGEASHGTEEYYRWRAEITKRLILEKGFTIIGVEGDWSDIYKLNQYIKGRSNFSSAKEILSTFGRWPTWMWANEEIGNLTEWLKDHNQNLPDAHRVGFYGLDIYGVGQAIEEASNFLQTKDPVTAAAALAAYNCFSSYSDNEEQYAYSPAGAECREEFVKLLAQATSVRNSAPGDEDYFSAEQNALIAVNGESYLKVSVQSYPSHGIYEINIWYKPSIGSLIFSAGTEKQLFGHITRMSAMHAPQT